MDSELSDDNCSDTCSEIWNDNKCGSDVCHETWNYKLGLLFYGELTVRAQDFRISM